MKKSFHFIFFVLLTGFVALFFFKMAVVTSSEGQIIGLTNFGNSIYASGLKWVIMLAPLAIVFLHELWNSKNVSC